MSRSVIPILRWPTPGSPALGLSACASTRSLPSFLNSGLPSQTRGPRHEPGQHSAHAQMPMSHDSIRLAARRSGCSTHIYAEVGAACCTTAHDESLGACGSDSLNASLWMVVVARRPPTREWTSCQTAARQSGLTIHDPSANVDFPTRAAGVAAGCPSSDDLQQRHGTVDYSNGPDGRRPGRHAYFGLRCGHSVLSGRVQGIQAEFSPRPMGRKLSTWAEAKFRTPGGHLDAVCRSWCRDLLAPARKALRHSSSTMCDIWAAPVDSDRWGLFS